VQKEAKKTNIKIIELESPGFLSPKNWLSSVFKNSKNYSQTRFYIAQRKRLNILIGDGGKPNGGKWSFDSENRKKIPKGFPIPKLSFPRPNKYLKEARLYVEKHFADNPGITDDFIYPITHDDAEKWLQNFFKNRFSHFGEYEDAMVRDEPFLFHSLLTPMLNIGLLTPGQVLERTFSFVENVSIPMNSLEGFVRQIIGWREFMRAIYSLEGERERSTNFWNHKRKVPSTLYTGMTGVEPVDIIIRRLNTHAYAHHIERLMIFGNFMVLCEIDPDEVYKWFMELFIDAYDWVMVPNVYGMSQYADGGLITTKPYISSSNYIRKMSDFPKGAWCDVWDGLYWRFIHKHRDFFQKNPRMSVMTLQLKRMGRDKLNKHLVSANEFLEKFWES
jgi:deoxyribodipyrimidine photolyase-related protein